MKTLSSLYLVSASLTVALGLAISGCGNDHGPSVPVGKSTPQKNNPNPSDKYATMTVDELEAELAKATTSQDIEAISTELLKRGMSKGDVIAELDNQIKSEDAIYNKAYDQLKGKDDKKDAKEIDHLTDITSTSAGRSFNLDAVRKKMARKPSELTQKELNSQLATVSTYTDIEGIGQGLLDSGWSLQQLDTELSAQMKAEDARYKDLQKKSETLSNGTDGIALDRVDARIEDSNTRYNNLFTYQTKIREDIKNAADNDSD